MDLKAQILNALDRQPIQVEVPEWKCAVFLKPMTGKEREETAALFTDGVDRTGTTMALLLQRSLCDANGGLLFSDEDVPKLADKNGIVLDRLFQQAQQLNGFDDKTDQDASKKN